MSSLLESARTAFSYFSILPVRGRDLCPAPDAAALVALPLVGAALGAIAGGAAWFVSRVAPRPLVVATAFTLPIVLSGAIHFDGFIDCCDAVFASVSPQRRLDILKDSAHGTYAVVAMAVVGVCSVAALVTVPPARLPAVLAYSGALVRLAAVWNARCFPYGRAGSKTRAFETRPDAALLALEALVLCAASFGFSRWSWAFVPLCCAAARLGGAVIATRLGGGLVGDAYGFLIVAIEPGIVALAALTCEAA